MGANTLKIRYTESNHIEKDAVLAKKLANKSFKGLSDEKHPWEQQPGETSKAYAGFAAYRDLGPVCRSATSAAEEVGGKHRSFRHWHQVFLWAERAEAWDKHLDKKSLSAQLRDVVKARKRFEDLGKALQEIGGHELEVLLGKIKSQKKGEKQSIGLSKSEMMRFLREGTRLELIGLGEPVEPQGEGAEGATSYGELAKMAAEFEKKNRQAKIAKSERENEERRRQKTQKSKAS